ncbi:MAG TPA: DHA2 family efflux MFS transporter permease subunit [Polyangiales bacterium]
MSTSAAKASRPKVNKWLVTLSVTFGTLMGAIDASIVNVALPHIRGAVGATVQEITWISTAFALSTVLVMPLTGFLGRLFGQKRVYMLCLCLFLLGSALCGTARSLFALVAYRALQGFGAGALQPTEQAILRQTFEPKEQGMAMAVFSLAVMVGPAIGPTLGGYIVDTWSWQWIFYINLPVGILGLLMVASFVHEDPEILAKNRDLAAAQRSNVDWSGIVLLSIGLASVQYFLEEGARDDWFDSRMITATFWIAIIALAAFVIRELTCPAPAVNIRLFKDRVFLSGTLIGAVMFAMLMANVFLLPIFMQEFLGFDATQAGVALMPRALVMMVVTPIVGRIYNHVSPRLIIAVGVVFFCYGAYAMSQMTLQSGTADVTATIAIQGIGFACLFVPLTTTALASIPRHLMPDATGLNSLFRQIGGSIGLAVFATLLGRYTVQARASVAAQLVPTRPEVLARLSALQHGFMSRGMDAHTAHLQALGALSGTVARQAGNLAFDRLFLLAGIAFLVVLPLLLFLKVVRTAAPAGASAAAQHLDL